jgi:hypothetical protein
VYKMRVSLFLTITVLHIFRAEKCLRSRALDPRKDECRSSHEVAVISVLF